MNKLYEPKNGSTIFSISDVKAFHKCKGTEEGKPFGISIVFLGATVTLNHDTEEKRDEEFDRFKVEWKNAMKKINSIREEQAAHDKIRLQLTAKQISVQEQMYQTKALSLASH